MRCWQMRPRNGMKPAAFAIVPKIKENILLDTGLLAPPAHHINDFCIRTPRAPMFYVRAGFLHCMLIPLILGVSLTFPF